MSDGSAKVTRHSVLFVAFDCDRAKRRRREVPTEQETSQAFGPNPALQQTATAMLVLREFTVLSAAAAAELNRSAGRHGENGARLEENTSSRANRRCGRSRGSDQESITVAFRA